MFRILSVVALAALAGCATHLVPMSETTPIPAKHILVQDVATPGAERVKMTVVRNAGALLAFGSRIDLDLDGRHVADIATSESIDLFVAPGEHLLTARVGPWASTVTAPAPSQFSIYRIDMTDSEIKLQPSVR
jgi:hypothetical protein